MPKQKNRMENITCPAAPLWRRVAALVYDSLLVSAIVLVTTAIYHSVINNWLLGRTEAPEGFNPWLSSLIIVIVFFFFAHCWGRNGQTLGMQAWRLRIQSTDDDSAKRVQHITLIQSLLRFITAIPALGLAGVGLWWIVVDRQKKSWHDRYSQTEIVLLPKRQ